MGPLPRRRAGFRSPRTSWLQRLYVNPSQLLSAALRRAIVGCVRSATTGRCGSRGHLVGPMSDADTRRRPKARWGTAPASSVGTGLSPATVDAVVRAVDGMCLEIAELDSVAPSDQLVEQCARLSFALERGARLLGTVKKEKAELAALKKKNKAEALESGDSTPPFEFASPFSFSAAPQSARGPLASTSTPAAAGPFAFGNATPPPPPPARSASPFSGPAAPFAFGAVPHSFWRSFVDFS